MIKIIFNIFNIINIIIWYIFIIWIDYFLIIFNWKINNNGILKILDLYKILFNNKKYLDFIIFQYFFLF